MIMFHWYDTRHEDHDENLLVAMRAQLIEHFHRQAAFTASYSPLYQRLFGTVASWLELQKDEKVVSWLLEAGAKRSPLETSLLLMAGMHRDVLLQAPGTENLSHYYPSVGGSRPHECDQLPFVFRDAIEQRMDSLTPLVQNETVQTNETARGIFWLFPTVLTRWTNIHLVDLGASAGLNLVADQRHFTLVDEHGDSISLGTGTGPQFVTQYEPAIPHFWNKFAPLPEILSRSGCDVNPILLHTERDQAALTSFVWADQVQRVKRLQEGIGAFQQVVEQMPIRVLSANLPDDLPRFLRSLPLTPEAPIVIFNTYMTTYLRDDGADMYHHIDSWAKEENHTVLWVQAEPARHGMEPKYGDHWCAWTVHFWEPSSTRGGGGCHRDWHIGWVHPHAAHVKWLEPGISSFVRYFGSL